MNEKSFIKNSLCTRHCDIKSKIAPPSVPQVYILTGEGKIIHTKEVVARKGCYGQEYHGDDEYCHGIFD